MEFRHECGRCHAPLPDDAAAYVCARDCTFCPTCYRRLKFACPNCSGELMRRPRSAPPPKPSEPSIIAPPASTGIRRAERSDVAALTPLFDAYRQFYEQPPDLRASGQFLSERLERDESVVFVAERAGNVVGFVQLYPLFSSVSLGRVYLLNDLFVVPDARRTGVGAALLDAARRWAEAEQAHYLELSTAVDNPAQRLYEAGGWRPDREFLYYELPLTARSRVP